MTSAPCSARSGSMIRHLWSRESVGSPCLEFSRLPDQAALLVRSGCLHLSRCKQDEGNLPRNCNLVVSAAEACAVKLRRASLVDYSGKLRPKLALSAWNHREPRSGRSRKRSIRKWLKFTAPSERRATAPRPCAPNYFIDYLSRRWAEGCVRGRGVLNEIKLRGYTGSFVSVM